jgi:hypothetical protein
MFSKAVANAIVFLHAQRTALSGPSELAALLCVTDVWLCPTELSKRAERHPRCSSAPCAAVPPGHSANAAERRSVNAVERHDVLLLSVPIGRCARQA